MFGIEREQIEPYLPSESAWAKIEQVRDYNLEPVTIGLNDDLIRAGRVYSVEQAYPLIARFGKCDYQVAKILEEEFRKFVVLTILEAGVPHAPSGAVDMYWHFFVLHTEMYHHFSDKIWGGYKGIGSYRHHYPAKDDTRAGMLRAYWNTLELYKKIFGEPLLFERPGALPVKIWTERSTTSGDSYSGIVDSCDPLTAEQMASFPDED